MSANIPILFMVQPGGDTTPMLNLDPEFHLIASQVDGYQELLEQRQRIDSAEIPRLDINARFKDDIAQFLDGRDLMEVARESIDARLEGAIEYADGMVRQAVMELDIRARGWLASAAPVIAEKLTARLTATVSDVMPLIIDGPLEHVRNSNDLLAHPDSAHALADFVQAAAAFARTAELARTLTPVTTDQWDLSWLFPRYDHAWPEFYLREGMNIVDPNSGAHFSYLEAVKPWWVTPDGNRIGNVDLLRGIVERGLSVWAPTPRQLAKANEEIQALAESQREVRNANEAQRIQQAFRAESSASRGFIVQPRQKG